jgi:cell division protein FtsB
MKNSVTQGTLYGCLFILMILFHTNHLAWAGNQKTIELNRRLAEISSLQERIVNLLALAVEKRDQLKKQRAELEKEIKNIRDGLQIRSFREAMSHPRINFNLKLIQQLGEYIARLNQRIDYFTAGNEILNFHLQQVKDDLQLIKTLNDMEVAELIDRIRDAVNTYLPETQKPIINVDNIDLTFSEEIWNEMTR